MKENILELQQKFNQLVEQANQGRISFEDVLEFVEIRDFLPPTQVIAAIWSVEDLREHFPEDTPDETLIKALHDISGAIHHGSVMVGHEIISDNLNTHSYFESEEDEELASCENCGENFHENEINMIDYDIDVCGGCERLLYKN